MKAPLLCLLFCVGTQSLVKISPHASSSLLISRMRPQTNCNLKESILGHLHLRLLGGSNNPEDPPPENSDKAAENTTEVLNGSATNRTVKRPPTPEVIQAMNYRLWEAARDGNEPLVSKALAAGANVNSFCRGPDKWINISLGEISGADEYTTGLNLHWMELNNYTAIHLAAASGNAAIIDRLVEAGADINSECLQRIHPMPTAFGSKIPFICVSQPIIYKCTPLRLARAANCGRCFYTSYAKSVSKLQAYGAEDRDFRFPLVMFTTAMALGLAYCGLNKWPWDWFSEWPADWSLYPDLEKYIRPGRGQ